MCRYKNGNPKHASRFICLSCGKIIMEKIQKMICEGFLNQRIRGLDGRTPEFPKMVFELRRGNNLEKDDPYYG